MPPASAKRFEKILSPKRSGKNRRLYSYNDLEKAKLILYLTRNLALNLSGVKIMLGILNELNISTVEYMLLIKKISNDKNINEDENISKSFKKGRKIKKDL